MIETHGLKCDFYQNNFKFCAVKKNYKYVHKYWIHVYANLYMV